MADDRGVSHPGTAVPVVGDEVRLRVGAVAHGGHCIARVGEQGLVVFVRHALPEELVTARITEVGGGGRFLRADAVEVHEPSPDRVTPPCPFAGPGRCGGCDWQHADLAAQRRLKAQVVTEQLVRLGGLDPDDLGPVVCEPLPGDQDGLRWRTRVEVAISHRPGQAPVSGLRQHRSHRVVPVDDCRIAHPGVLATGGFADPAALVAAAPVPDHRVTSLDLVAPAVGEPVAVPLALPAPRHGRRQGGRGRDGRGGAPRPRPVGAVPQVTERVHDQDFTLSARGFWQVHPGAASTFTDQVLDWLGPRPGERALDLYAGVGLFAVPLAQAVGERGAVLAVESDREAVAAAEEHLRAYPWAEAVAEQTATVLDGLVEQREDIDLVVLDPPRTGAGAPVMTALAALAPRAVVYVACDPAALARDLATAAELGLRLAGLRVLDAFPMTHHVECLALLLPDTAQDR